MSSINIMLASFKDTFVNAFTKNITSVIFVVFVIIAVGYMLGRINIKGISLGSSAVFIVALVVGVLLSLYGPKLGFGWAGEDNGGATVKAVREIGLALFITGIGFGSGPTFIRNFKNKAFSYITIGFVAVAVGTILTVIIIKADDGVSLTNGLGIMMGGLSTTPGLSSAQGLFEDAVLKGEIAATYGLTYPISVLGIVLFAQFMPKIMRANMDDEVKKLRDSLAPKKVEQTTVDTSNAALANPPKAERKLFEFDSLGLAVFSIAVALGMVFGSLTFQMGASAKFALGTTGGCLIVGLLFGHFGRLGRISLKADKKTVSVLKEFGLVMFLASSGIEGGLNFIQNFKWSFLLYGAIITFIPMIAAFLVGKLAFKLELLNNLGSVCGGMTSTPALGALIHVSKAEEVSQAYAATYPIALFMLVFAPQIINLIC